MLFTATVQLVNLFTFILGISGDVFGDLVAGIHSISIQFIPAGSPQILNCLPLSNFTISTPGELTLFLPLYQIPCYI